jgi:hypothetical protein
VLSFGFQGTDRTILMEADRKPLTKRARAFDFVSCGLAILSRKGRGKTAAPTRLK